MTESRKAFRLSRVIYYSININDLYNYLSLLG